MEPGTPCSHADVPLSMADRVRDIDKVLDELPGWFGDRVDTNRAGLLGHSRGTATALAAAGGTFPLTDPRATTANCQSRTNPIVSPDGIARCWPLAPGMEHGLSRVKAVMGTAIAARPITRGADLENVAVPTLLVSGSLDETSPSAISDFAAERILDDQTPPRPAVTRVSVTGADHRTFASTYCDQTQAAAASADKEEEGRIGNGDRTVDALELQDWNARAFLDHHTASETVRGAPPNYAAVANNNSVTQFCASATFTRPVDITSVVGPCSARRPRSTRRALRQRASSTATP